MADAVAEIEAEGATRAVKDLFAGAVGGVAQVLLGELSMIFRTCPQKEQGSSLKKILIPTSSLSFSFSMRAGKLWWRETALGYYDCCLGGSFIKMYQYD